MGNLYLVRHGQASFGAADYDNLSELGHRQSVRLGEYFAGKGLDQLEVLPYAIPSGNIWRIKIIESNPF